MMKLFYGRAFNDVDFPVSQNKNGVRKNIPSYQCWTGMLMRCYCKKYQARKPTYAGCEVSSEWWAFSAFFDWYNSQPKEDGWHLDKDLLIPGNKVYSPKNCIFVSQKINKFTNDCRSVRGNCMLGVNRVKNKYQAKCNNPFLGKCEHLGYFFTEQEAHQVWRNRKHELACDLADTVSDGRLAKALRERYV